MGAQEYAIKQNILFHDNQSILMEKTERNRALGTSGTSIYVIYLLRTRLKATKCQFRTAAQNKCLQISLQNPYKKPYLRNFVT